MRAGGEILDAERLAAGRDGRGERGAVIVEFAFILPLLLLLTFGIIEFSKMYSTASTVSNATRAGARTASAEPRVSGFADDTAKAVTAALSALPGNAPQELWVYHADANNKGLPDSGNFSTRCTQCVVYRWDTTLGKFVSTYSNWPATQQNACGASADEIGVWIKAQHTFNVPYFGGVKSLTSKTVMRLEPIPSSANQTCS